MRQGAGHLGARGGGKGLSTTFQARRTRPGEEEHAHDAMIILGWWSGAKKWTAELKMKSGTRDLQIWSHAGSGQVRRSARAFQVPTHIVARAGYRLVADV